MRFLYFAVLLLAPACGQAQLSSAPLTMEDAVAQAIKNNPRLSAATREILASHAGVDSARALANPEIKFTPGITSLSGTGEELLISQALELNGTRAARTGLAKANLRKTQAQALAELRNLVFETKTAYYQLARALNKLSLARELLKSAEEFDRIARLQVDAGARPGIETAQTAIEVARARQQATQSENEVAAARAELNTLLGRNPADSLGTPVFPAPAPRTLDRDDLLKQALLARSEIAVEEAVEEALRQEARLARAEGVPDIAPQLRIGSLLRGIPAAGTGNGFGIGLAVNLPIFDYGSRRNRVRQAEEAGRAQSDRITAARNDVRREVEQAINRASAAEAILTDYQRGVLDQSRRLLEASRTGYQEGKTSIIALLESQRTYRAVHADYANAQSDYALALAELERATGSVAASLLPEPRRSR